MKNEWVRSRISPPPFSRDVRIQGFAGGWERELYDGVKIAGSSKTQMCFGVKESGCIFFIFKTGSFLI